MKIALIGILCVGLMGCACDMCATVSKADEGRVVEASCGQCQFEMAGKGCDLAVRIDGVGYYVDGTKIDDHGDAHGATGFCEMIRKARVVGEVVDGRFKVESFELLGVE